MRLTATQQSVVDWMRRYPDLYITESGGRIWWNATWASEPARRHMNQTVGVLMGGKVPEIRATDLKGGSTPRLRVTTWRALKRFGAVRPFARVVTRYGIKLRYRLHPAWQARHD